MPPGLQGPGVRERFARLAIDLSPVRISRPFRWFWLGQAVKDLGSGVIFVALPHQIYQLTGSTLAVAMLSFVELVPLLTLTLVGGALADAVDRRRLMIWTQLGMAATGIALVVNAALPHPQAWALFVLAFCSASFFCLGIGGLRSITPRLVPEDKLPAALVLESISGSFSSVAGPALGGVLIGFAGLVTTYTFDVVTFAFGIASILALPRIEPVADADRPSLRSILEGSATCGRSRSSSASCSST